MQLSPSNILIADDNKINRDILVFYLQKHNHHTLEAQNGNEALELARANPIDLILLDIIMPEKDGFQVLKELKNDKALREIPVIVISDLGDMESTVQCIELGAEDFLPKPFNPILLKARVDSSLEKKRLHEQEKAQLEQAKKQTEDALQISEERLRTVIAEAPVVLFTLSPDGIFTFMDGKGLQPFGDQFANAVGKNYKEVLSNNPETFKDFQKALKGEAFTTNIKMGHLVYETRFEPQLNSDKKIDSIIGIAIDITERVHREKELKSIVEFTTATREVEFETNLIETILDQIALLLKAQNVVLAIRDKSKNTTIINAGLGIWKEWGGKELSKDQSINWDMLANTENTITDEIDVIWPFCKNKVSQKSSFLVPLIEQDKVIGAICVNREDKIFDSNEINLFVTLGEIAANALHRNHLIKDLKFKNIELVQTYDSTLEGWSKALDYRDKETGDHTQRVTDLTLHLARELGIGEKELVLIRRGAILHDIGKMAIPDKILLKEGPLDPDEWVLIKQHPQHAVDMLSDIEYLKPALTIPYYHHEHWDGSGYPQGLKGEDIPLAARIFSVVDVWDALTNDRPYRKAMRKDKVIKYMLSESGKYFDPAILETFIKLIQTYHPAPAAK